MKLKSRNRLRKRGGYFHYYDYYIANAKYQYLCRKFGKEVVDNFYAENLTGDYKKNMQVEFLDARGRYTSIQLFRGCYPSSVQSVEDTVSVSFRLTLGLEGDV